MKVSIVIPVYNEAERLDACLRSIAAQSTAPYEVIVVDNNSTDASVMIVQRYPFVRLLHEKRQGVVHARNRGFDAARGGIIGRIDADTVLPASWVAQVQTLFADDPAMSAVSGAVHYYDVAMSRLADSMDYRIRAHLSPRMGTSRFLFGANMAVRRSAWRRVRHTLCNLNDLYEDCDLAIHLQAQGLFVAYEPQLLASVSSRRIDTGFRAYLHYSLMWPHTYAMHRLRARYHLYPVLVVCWAVYLPARLIYRGCDPETGTFSLSRLLRATTPRIDPTTNVA